LTLPGVIPPTLVPEAAEVPQSQLWSLDRFNIFSLFIYPGLMLYADDPIICRTSMNIPVIVPSLKVDPAGTADNPDGTYSLGSYPGISTRLPREAKSNGSHRNLKLLCHHERTHDVTVHSALTAPHHGLVARLQ
jgi:hypothetical protein